MKRITLLLARCAALLLAACGAAPAPAAVPTATPTPTEEPTPVPTDTVLFDLLDTLRDRVQPGTAGSSLKAAVATAALLDWAETAPAPESTEATAAEWLARQDEEALSRLPEQLASLRGSLEQLSADYDSAAGLLADAGAEEAGPWTAEAAQTVSALLDALES